ncbi:hypothetical protein MCOR27_011736 [Pyricularia oryzae]|uniref:Uncharacterized protein n=5 Tax=Pyricularia TaxID=48558 RepID=A0ABQ8NGB6_PYRGI|nr:uncharacterized protein MGG_16205 [Pyricularia oryzae 70-15]ELQ43637.1 hypothetical protein OOU_Y34scaffold00140g45 [Pyricularia oryzae Y34]KAH8842225.1 hypothetical protein MCOR01_006151 [Pyricularia oryzae]KAI6296610.1 hypothetical protein MCOR33_006819 [Pyricularia grisea]EHA57013.1 hypothetical protein MGG_16205 [Pyricularia oryzae 70-15]KAH9435459.1 hypothetical protein MCOR02_004394 [Pyricularia oryzae]
MQGRSGPKPKFTISRLVVIMEDGNFRPPSPRGTDGGPPATQPLIRANGGDEKAFAGRNSGRPKVPPERGGDRAGRVASGGRK